MFLAVSEDVNGNSGTNGNTTSDAEKSYEWDGANRLVAINCTGTTTRTEFTYDGMGRRVRIQELLSGTATSDKRFVWDGMSIAEQRASDGATVERQYFGSGFKESGGDKYYYVRDHPGSMRAVIDETGVERGRWAYDVYGNRSLNQVTTSAVEADFGYTGHYQHKPSALVLALSFSR